MDKIVVIDDFHTNTIVMKSSLTHAGFKILEADNPKKALDFFEGRQIDMLVTDFKMPGTELTKAVKFLPQYQNLPILISF